jgi:hypothetical protein
MRELLTETSVPVALGGLRVSLPPGASSSFRTPTKAEWFVYGVNSRIEGASGTRLATDVMDLWKAGYGVLQCRVADLEQTVETMREQLRTAARNLEIVTEELNSEKTKNSNTHTLFVVGET